MPFISTAEKSIITSQDLMEALKHPAPAAPYGQIGENQLEDIDALAKISIQQVEEKGIIITS